MHRALYLAAASIAASSALARPQELGAGFEVGAEAGPIGGRFAAGGRAGHGEVAAGFDVAGKLGPFSAEIAAGGEADLELCHGAHAGLAVGAKVKLGCEFHTPDFRARMNTPAHLRYEEALELYHDIMHLIRHTLMTRGVERALRLIEIASMIRDGEEILVIAGTLNTADGRKIRRRWIAHEIHSLEAKFRRARFWACHLPNLYLAEDFFKFTLNAGLKVVEFAVAVPIVVGAAIGLAVVEAAHLVARAFHFMGRVLRWAIDEIEFAFIMFARKLKRGIKKVVHGIEAGVVAIGHGLHHLGHELKEGLEDGVSIVVDIGHHLFHRHHCHHKCNAEVGLIIVDDSSSSSSSEEQCDCSSSSSQEDDYATVTEVCVEKEEVCSKETYTAKVSANYNVEINWTKEESIEKVKTTLLEVNQAMTAFTADLKKMEVDASVELRA